MGALSARGEEGETTLDEEEEDRRLEEEELGEEEADPRVIPRLRGDSTRSPIVMVALRLDWRVGCVFSKATGLMGTTDCLAATGMLAKLLEEARGSLIVPIDATEGSMFILLSVGLRRLSDKREESNVISY